MSQISKVIDNFIREYIAPINKQQGFKKRGRNFHKALVDCIYVINVQASQWNEADSGQFTINLGVYFPNIELETWGDIAEITERPTEPRCTARTRIGSLVEPYCDKWWEISPTSSQAEIGNEVVHLINTFGFKWQESMSSSRDALLEHLVKDHDYCRAAVVEKLQGNMNEAKALYHKERKHKRGAAERIIEFGKRLGFED